MNYNGIKVKVVEVWDGENCDGCVFLLDNGDCSMDAEAFEIENDLKTCYDKPYTKYIPA